MAQFNIENSRVTQLNDSGDNLISTSAVPEKRGFWRHFRTWYGLLGTTASLAGLIIAWYALHRQYGYWFFGMD